MSLALKAFAWLVFGFVITALPRFLAAGTLAWPAGWIDLILLYGWLFIGILLLLKYNPGLLAERMNVSPSNQKTWDKVFLLLFYVFFFAWLIVMPLDAVRFHSSWLPICLKVVGPVAMVVSFILCSLAFHTTPSFSPPFPFNQDLRHTAF